MFLGAVAIPQWDTFRNIFLGGIYYYSLNKQAVTRQSSPISPTETLQTNSQSLTIENYESLFLQSFKPAMQNKFPRHCSQKMLFSTKMRLFKILLKLMKFQPRMINLLYLKIISQPAGNPNFHFSGVKFFPSVQSSYNQTIFTVLKI